MKASQLLQMGHGPKIVIPDYKIYQVGEHTPELLELQKKLAEKGLKDPWIRNYVWRYDLRDRLARRPIKAAQLFFRGIVPGFVCGSILAVAWWEYEKRNGHGHGHDHH